MPFIIQFLWFAVPLKYVPAHREKPDGSGVVNATAGVTQIHQVDPAVHVYFAMIRWTAHSSVNRPDGSG
jgi:hypothetical protein